MFELGKKAPAFTLENQNKKKVKLKDFVGKWVVIYFYPRDNTPGCTIEATQFTELKKQFDKNQIVLFGCSPDDDVSHQRFIEKKELTIDLLSDPSNKMMEKYQAYGEKNMYGKIKMGVIRSTVIIDPKGKVAHHWKRVKSNGHAQKVLEKTLELMDK